MVLDGFIRASFRLGRETTDKFAPFLAMRRRGELAANECLSRMEVTEAETGERFTHVLWVDDDVVIDGEVVTALLDAVDDEHPVVAALAFERHCEMKPAIWAGVWFGVHLTAIKQILEYPADTMIPITASGLCCVAFDRDVFDMLHKPYFDWIQKGHTERLPCTPDGWIFGQFDDQKIPCFCHTGIKVGHMGHPQVVDEAYALARKGKWTPSEEIPCMHV